MNTLLFVSKLVFNLVGLGAAVYVFYYGLYRQAGFFKPISYVTLLCWIGFFIADIGVGPFPTWYWSLVNPLCLIALAVSVHQQRTREKSPLL